MAGILGLGGTAPQPTIVPLDAGTNGLIDQAVARGQQSQQQFADQQNQGVTEGSQQASQTPQAATDADQSRGYGEGGQAINTAIRNQYQSQSGATINRLKDAYSQNAAFQKNQALQQASAEAMARQKVTTQSYATLMNAYNQTEAARAQVLNSILGAGGMMAGAAAARPKQGAQQSITDGPGVASAGAGEGSFNAGNIA